MVTHRGLFAQQAPSALAVERLLRAARPALRPVDVRYVQPELRVLASSHSPDGIKALYVNAWAFGSSRLWHLVRLADSTEINALVVDVKDDTGCLLYPSSVATARAIGAGACARTKTVRERLDTLHAHGIYPIARIVVAKDPLLAERRHGWAVRNRESGELWRDRIGSAWVDAHNDSVWIYAAQLAEEAVLLGFREVQFDYVRFPDEPAERMATAIFPARKRGETQRGSVRRHVRLLVERLEHLGVPVTFDIFGLTASAMGDMGIGQVWEDFTTVADVVLPMVYPSHYYRGAYGLERPNAHPYLVVRRALQEAIDRSRDPGSARIRPYLQAFTLGRRLPRYTAHEIREQIRAAEELGLTSWVLWNPRSVYRKEALRPYYRSAAHAGTVLVTGSEPQ
jgi:hypothetical protein